MDYVHTGCNLLARHQRGTSCTEKRLLPDQAAESAVRPQPHCWRFRASNLGGRARCRGAYDHLVMRRPMRFAAHRELSTAALVLLVTDEGRAAAEGTAWRGSNRGTPCGPRGSARERNDE